ncbi:DUF5931 domain-containing protein, partial [Actinomadura sp. 9N215]|uniref:DUF5931 domain-containing protein n=1 Tax=Actinomadura sp. 9N215 TaxID=3375150 RepID=UPI0037A2543D
MSGADRRTRGADPGAGGADRGMGLEAALWRALAVYRGLALLYAASVIAMNFDGYARP